MSKPVEIYQIKVALRDSQPVIWRRIQVRSDITLAKLHRILQCVMGWQDSHLHQFVIQDQRYGVPDEDDAGPRETKDERKYKLGDMLPGENSQFMYDPPAVEASFPPRGRAASCRQSRSGRGPCLSPGRRGRAIRLPEFSGSYERPPASGASRIS